jgi:molecular chaperone DnaK
MAKFMSIGIDHGTTNSALAVMGAKGPSVLKPDGVEEIMPSVVYMTRSGRLLVGKRAYQALYTNSRDEGVAFNRYKTRIGQDDRYSFPNGEVKTGADLGALVIGELLNAYYEESGERATSAVVTVPANFQQSDCDATVEAARKAGLKEFHLLQEPIAAALAYGFSAANRNGTLVVFDFGGGTLDISLVFMRGGELFVPPEGHAGDNNLGGGKFDKELIAYTLKQLAIQGYNLQGFGPGSNKYLQAYQRLMLAVELAKIELSHKAVAEVEALGLCDDENGKQVDVSVRITRKEFEELIKADVERAVHLCESLISSNGLRNDQINSIILVGGPSKTPYLQQKLRERLKISLSSNIDPMTAVAQGAAIFAALQEVAEDQGTPQSTAGLKPRLSYQHNSEVNSAVVVVDVDIPEDVELPLTVEVRSQRRTWEETLDATGSAELTLELQESETPHLNEFVTTIRDRNRRELVRLAEPEIWYPYSTGTLRLANSLRVSLRDDSTFVILAKGKELPTKGVQEFVTAKELKRGSTEDLLKIPIVEGVALPDGTEAEKAKHCIHVGTLTIAGNDEQLTKDLPAGSPIEVTIKVNQSREVTAIAFVPWLDAEFEATFARGKDSVDVDTLSKRVEAVKERLARVKRLNEREPNEAVQTGLTQFENEQTVTAIGTEIERANGGDLESLSRAQHRLIQLEGMLERFNNLQRGIDALDRIEKLQSSTDGEEASQVRELGEALQAARSSGDAEQLESLRGRLAGLETQIHEMPVLQLCIDWLAFPDRFNGTQEKLDAFRKAEKLAVAALAKQKSGGTFTPAELKEMTEAHDNLMRQWDDLPKWRQKYFEEQGNTQGRPTDMRLSDLAARRS